MRGPWWDTFKEDGLVIATSKMSGTARRSKGSIDIRFLSEVHRPLCNSVIAHAKDLDITPQDAMTRAWWFYLATYEKKAVPDGRLR